MEQAVDTLTEIVARATRAPSMHNVQPWRFRVEVPGADLQGAVVEVRADRTRSLPVADPTGWAMRVGCGAVVYAVGLGISVHGHHPEVTVLPDASDQDLIARIRAGVPHRPTPQERDLYTAIPRRRSNRFPFSEVPAAPEAVRALVAAAHAEGAWLDVLDDPRQRAAVADLLHQGQERLSANPAYREELRSWLRDDGGSPDGIPREAAGVSPLPYDLLAFRGFSDRQRPPGRDFEPNPLVCVLGTTTDHEAGQVHAGMALHRVLLAGTAGGLASSMLSQPIEVPDLRHRLRTELGRLTGWPQMVLRFGYGVRTPATPRRPVEDVLEITATRS